MGRYKRIGMLLILLFVIAGTAFGVSRYEEKKELIKNSDEIILAIDSGTVSALSWEYGSETLSFHRDEKWVYDGDEAFPVDAEKMDELLSVFREFGASFVIEDVDDYGQYGLDDPVCLVHVTADGISYEVLVGAFSTMDSERYVTIRQVTGGNEAGTVSEDNGGGQGNAVFDKKVYLVKKDPLDYFDAVLSDVIKHDENLSYEKIAGIRFDGAQSQEIIYSDAKDKSYCPDDVYYLKGATDLPLDSTRVDGYLAVIGALNLTDYVTYNVTENELKTYGLDDPELSVDIDYFFYPEGEDDEETLIEGSYKLQLSRLAKDREAEAEKLKAEQENAKMAGADGTEEAEREEEADEDDGVTEAYLRIGNSQIIYRISSTEYENLMTASYNDLRHREVFTADFWDVTRIEVRLEDTDYKITSEKEDEVSTYYYEGEVLDLTAFRNALNVMEASEFTEEEPSQKEEICLKFDLDNENFPSAEIRLYRYDGTNCLAVVDGKPVSLVSRESVINLVESVNAIVLN